ncbi:MAG: DUF4384 domain-containing protein [Candidatus Eiseniibacteriota bacterium]
MSGRWWSYSAFLALLAMAPAAAGARSLDVEVWTDRGDDAVYQPGDALEVRARVSDDAYLMVYEIDAEGYVRLLFPFQGGSGFVERRRTYTVPPERANVELVVEKESVGQCYVVAIASRERFRELPWYLRPYDLQAEQVGYEGMRDDDEGITSEGRIVGDPFVAMEKIRRRVAVNPEDPDAFATGYATYYVHHEVRYPRYLCYDCHRPGRWAWWSGFDPYYAHCSVFDFRVNWSWGWGPGYWFGTLPYYCYVVRPDCPPYYRSWYGTGRWFSAWDGWRRWNTLWGDHLVRFKTDPPRGYVPPSKYPDRGKWRDGSSSPPGFLVSDVRKGREGFRPRMITGRRQEATPREYEPREDGRAGRRLGGPAGRPRADRAPGRDLGGRNEGGRGSRPAPGGEYRERASAPMPRIDPSPRGDRPREEMPSVRPRENAPRQEKPRDEPAPRYEKRPEHAPADRPRESRGNDARRSSDDRSRAGHRTKG